MLHLLSRASAFLVVCLLQINVSYAATYGLNTTCSPPVSQGGTGYCGPSYCSAINNPATGCVFTAKTYNYATIISGLRSKTCTQSTDPRCTSAALKALIVGQGIKAAYCNDQFLVLQTDGTTGYANTLTSIKNPPAAVGSDGKTCVTRYVNQGFATVKIPLFPTLLTTADPRINNINTNSFPNGGADGDAAYMSTSTMNTAATYGLPTRGKSFLTSLFVA